MLKTVKEERKNKESYYYDFEKKVTNLFKLLKKNDGLDLERSLVVDSYFEYRKIMEDLNKNRQLKNKLKQRCRERGYVDVASSIELGMAVDCEKELINKAHKTLYFKWKETI